MPGEQCGGWTGQVQDAHPSVSRVSVRCASQDPTSAKGLMHAQEETDWSNRRGGMQLNCERWGFASGSLIAFIHYTASESPPLLPHLGCCLSSPLRLAPCVRPTHKAAAGSCCKAPLDWLLRAGSRVRNVMVAWCALVDTRNARVLLAQRNKGLRELRELYELPGGKVGGGPCAPCAV